MRKKLESLAAALLAKQPDGANLTAQVRVTDDIPVLDISDSTKDTPVVAVHRSASTFTVFRRGTNQWFRVYRREGDRILSSASTIKAAVPYILDYLYGNSIGDISIAA